MMIGEKSMKINHKIFMSYSIFNFVDSLIPQEIINSGDYKKAENLILNEGFSSEKLPDIFYILGNKFFSSKQKTAAERSWKKSKEIVLEKREDNYTKNIFLKNTNTNFSKIISIILFLIICIYLCVLLFFKREPIKFQFGIGNINSKEMSLWDEWWDTGRPFQRDTFKRYGLEELWPLINQTLADLFGEKSLSRGSDIQEKLKDWLELSQIPKFKKGPTDKYALTARGLFEAREFDDAISTLIDSLNFAEIPQEFEKIYQDLGTVYYYRGYKLGLNGLAKYNISDVRKSVESYEKALIFGEDPYLYGNLGWGYFLLNDFDSSIERSIKALSLRPELNYVRMNLGIAYLKMGNYDMSFSAYASILRFSPQIEEYEGGIRDILELQMESPGVYPFTNFLLGQLYWQQGLYKKSRSALKIFISQKFPKKIWKDRASLLLEKMISE